MMRRTGSLWNFHSEKKWVVIPTNIGWKMDGSNPMGAGVARQAADLYPDLASWYGKRCKKYGADTAVCPHIENQLFLFPTKPLDDLKPWLSWKNDADINLVRRSAEELPQVVDYVKNVKKAFVGEIGIPLVGCGEGKLDKQDVIRILDKYLDDRFILFTLPM